MKRLLLLLLIILLIVQVPFAVGETPSSWAKETIDEVFSLNLLDERLQGDYQGMISRKDFAYLGVQIYEKLTGVKTTVGAASFTDSNDPYVLRAKNFGIVNGYPDGSFKPDAPIKRDELAVLFVNALSASGVNLAVDGTSKFSDDTKIAAWANASVYAAKAYGIVNGVGNNKYNPTGTATREQAIAMFKRVYDGFTTSTMPETATSGFQPGQKAPNFTLMSTNNKSITLSDFKGKPVVLNFFASWCPPCLDEMPDIQALYNENKEDVHFIGVNLTAQDSVEDLVEMINTLGISFTIVKDEKGSVAASYGIRAIPTSVFIDASGIVSHYQVGAINYDTLKGYVEEMK